MPSIPSWSSFVQYTILLGIAYILAGAPLLDSIYAISSSTRRSKGDSPLPELTPEEADRLVIPDPNLTCPEHNYEVRVFWRDPLVLYIKNFLSQDEAKELVELSEPLFKPSTIWSSDKEHADASVRKSEKALLPRSSSRVQCIEARARAIQGWRPYVFVEKMWTQRYTEGGHYAHHYDWARASSRQGRISSFMVYVAADNCTGGGTNFPLLPRPSSSPGGGSSEWCQYVECGERSEKDAWGREVKGVTFKAITGAAIYWENFRPNGEGYEESWHAGLPVERGIKVGLNIWSWLQDGWDPYKRKSTHETA